MYRDGLGEGQIEYAKDKEIVAIKKVFKDNDMPDIKFTFIVVSKRINIQFFLDGARLEVVGLTVPCLMLRFLYHQPER